MSIDKEDVKAILREVIGGMKEAAAPTPAEALKIMMARPIKEEVKVNCVTPDGCRFVAVLAPHSLKGNVVKELQWESFPNPIPWPDGYKPQNPVTGELSAQAKHMLFENYTRRWHNELVGKELPWYLHPDAREAVEKLEEKKRAAIAKAPGGSESSPKSK